MSEKTLEMTMLFDFYGDLLTDKQKEYFDLYYNGDLSLSEIAENDGITRQGVRDILRRAEATLLETEHKTGLLKRFSENRLEIDKLLSYTVKIRSKTTDSEILKLTDKIIKSLEFLKQ